MDTDTTVDGTVDEASAASTRKANVVWVHLLIVLSAVILLVTAVDVWVDRALLNTDNWVDASDELLADPAVREAVSVYVVDQLYSNIDVGSELSGLLPDNLSGLSGPLATALRNPATEAVDRLLATPQLAAVWTDANRAAHETIVKILKDETNPAASTADGVVTLDLREVVVQLAATLGLPSSLVDRIPADVGQVTVIESQTLADAQSAVKLIEWASWLLFFLVIALFALAIFLADGWRRVASRTTGISILIVGLLLLAGLRFGGDRLLDSVVKNESNRPAADAVWRIGSSLLKDIGGNIAAIGMIVIIGAAIAGPSRIARSIRRVVAPALAGSPGIRWGIGAAILLILVIWAPLRALTSWIGILIVAVVIAACIEGLRGLCIAERSEDEAAGEVVSSVDEPVSVES